MLKFLYPLKLKEIKYFAPPSLKIPQSGVCYALGGVFHKIDKNSSAFLLKNPKTKLVLILPLNIRLTSTNKFSPIGHIFCGTYKDGSNNIYNKLSQTIELEQKLDSKSKNFIKDFLIQNNLKTLLLKDIETKKIYQIKRR